MSKTIYQVKGFAFGYEECYSDVAALYENKEDADRHCNYANKVAERCQSELTPLRHRFEAMGLSVDGDDVYDKMMKCIEEFKNPYDKRAWIADHRNVPTYSVFTMELYEAFVPEQWSVESKLVDENES